MRFSSRSSGRYTVRLGSTVWR